MIRFIVAFNYLFLFNIFISCQNTDDPSNGGDLNRKDYRYDGNLNIDGYSRYYLLNLPPGYYESSDFPLVIALHGAGGNALQCERDYKLTEKANAENHIIVYPEGIQSEGILGFRTWNAGYCCQYAAENNSDDVKFISLLIDKLISSYKIDPNRIYVTGMSNGAMMAYRLACEIPDKIAAIASVSGSMVTEHPGLQAKPMPILHIHSQLDTKVPPLGGIGLAGYYYPPVDSVLRIWAVADSCNSREPVVQEFESYTRYQWYNCNNGASIVYFLTKDGGHAWPGGLKSRNKADNPSQAINANDSIWSFFKRYELP